MDNLDLICTQCPLETCNERSLWCALRFATNPNKAQRELIEMGKQIKITTRRKYYKEYYQANRDKKLAAANERNRRLRIEG